jgi:CRP/FNR family transcriptional regulator, cyclic AMP receptor protein
MSCNANELRHVPLFSLLDEDELLVLSQQVELRDFAAKQRIYKAGDPGDRAFVMMSGAVEVSLLDEDGQEVVFSEPKHGDFFGFASMLEGIDHQTTAIATEPTTCLEVDRNDIAILLEKKPQAGIDMMTVLARDIHTAQGVIRGRSMRNPNELLDEQETFGERIADKVASFGGSWSFIILFAVTLVSYTIISNLMHNKSWDPYPYILLNLFLSMLAAIQAPVIMMSQNRQDHKDRVRSELDFEVNRRAEAEIQALSRKIHFLTDKLGDVEEHLRGPSEPRREDDLQG